MPGAPDGDSPRPGTTGPGAAHGLTDAELIALAASAFDGLASAVLAVSGGADSRLLMLLAERWRAPPGAPSCQFHVATVDHGLRTASATEARWVGEQAALAKVPHHTLKWEGKKPKTGLQEAARKARYRLLEELAVRLALPEPTAISTGHHLDDQAETFIMRLARGSGVDGLAAMRTSRLLPGAAGIFLTRPLLELPKSRITATLKERDIGWLEDPSNLDPRFERARVRKALEGLEDIGVTAGAIARSADRLGRARTALEILTNALIRRTVDVHGGAFAELPLIEFDNQPEELRLRLLQRLVAWFGSGQPPRMTQLEDVTCFLSKPVEITTTLGGCWLARHRGGLVARREPGRDGLPVITLAPGDTQLWDNRFTVTAAPDRSRTATVKALPPETWPYVRERRHNAGLPAEALPRAAALTLPTFWEGDRLLGAAHPQLMLAAGLTGQGLSAEFAWR